MDVLRVFFPCGCQRQNSTIRPSSHDRSLLESDPEDTIVQEATTETSEGLNPRDEIHATYSGYRMAFFMPPPIRYDRSMAAIDVHSRVTVCLDHFDFTEFGQLPGSAHDNISVLFLYNGWKVRVPVPYIYARSKIPSLPELCEPGNTSCRTT
ncbi:hypothetical protein BDV06DRAFT_116125 [Aspergillus oleicola]